MARARKYDIVVFGATGYTGKCVSEAILRQAPSTLRWAIAGRSPHKLELLKQEYNRIYHDRVPVETFICDLSEFQIEKMVSVTRLLITTVGPFIKYGTPVLEACAVYGTHYVDSTGEFPWVYEMVKKCHRTAKTKGAIIIPQCGFESAPADLATYSLVKTIRDELGVGTGKVTFALHKIKGQFSGGTFESFLNLFETATLQEIDEAAKYDSMAPVKPPEQPFQSPITKHPELGRLCPSVADVTDRVIVFRSWGLIDGGKYYGSNFVWKEYMRTSNILSGIIVFLVVNIGAIMMMFGPFRWLFRKARAHAPGEGPDEEMRKGYGCEWRGIAEADDEDGDENNPRKAMVTVQGPDAYTLTGIFCAETALAILYDKDKRTIAGKLGGGVMTPACVASPELFQRLDRAGVKIETKMM